MVKVNKTPVIILLSFTIAFLAATLILLFVPEPKPLAITQEFKIVQTDEGCFLKGKIKNQTDGEATFGQNTISRIQVYVLVKSGYDGKERELVFTLFKEDTAVAAHAEAEVIHKLGLSPDDAPVKITRISAKVNGNSYFNLYGNIVNDGTFAIIALFTGLACVIFLIITVTTLAVSVHRAKRANAIISRISQECGGGIYAAGYYGNKNQERAETAKTVFSTIGSIILQLFSGIGIYRVYNGRRLSDYVVTNSAVYEIYGKQLEFKDVLPQLKGIIKNANITYGKKKLTLTDDDGTYFTLLVKDGEREELAAYLTNAFKG